MSTSFKFPEWSDVPVTAGTVPEEHEASDEADAPAAAGAASEEADAPDTADAASKEADAPAAANAASEEADTPAAADAASKEADAPATADAASEEAEAPATADAALEEADAPATADAASEEAEVPDAASKEVEAPAAADAKVSYVLASTGRFFRNVAELEEFDIFSISRERTLKGFSVILCFEDFILDEYLYFSSDDGRFSIDLLLAVLFRVPGLGVILLFPA